MGQEYDVDVAGLESGRLKLGQQHTIGAAEDVDDELRRMFDALTS